MGIDPENWMGHLDPSTRVIDTYIPGSHDSSCYPGTGDIWEQFKNDWVGSVTQLGSYTAQCNAGVRYFDMRCAFHDNDVYMHHASYYYQRLSEVLAQLRKFADYHPKEFLFLDIDFDGGDAALEKTILELLTQTLGGESRFVTSHALPGGGYNTSLTWRDLANSRQAQFIILWRTDHSGKLWAPPADSIRYDHFDNFDRRSPQWILEFLTSKLNEWQKDKLFCTQVVNTPLLSPLTPPGDKDLQAAPLFNKWILEHRQGSNLGIVKRDFVNAEYNRAAIEHIILLNSFTSPPDLPPLTTPIHYRDMIRLRTQDNGYVCVQIDPVLCKLTVVDTPTTDCNFLIRDYDYSPTKEFPYSGNLDADTIDCQGNFRMAHLDTRPPGLNVGNDYVLSVDNNSGNRIFWGIGWGPSDNNETFTCFDPDHLSNDGQIYDGSRVMIRSMLRASNNGFDKFIRAVGQQVILQTPFAGKSLVSAIENAPGNHLFWMTSYDETGTARIYAASPGTLLADSFVVEKFKVRA